jgi:hypothetical protein
MKLSRKSFPIDEKQKKDIKESLDTRLFVKGKIPITGRSFTNYSIQLFPDVSSTKLISYMNDKDYLDLACGINHLYPQSLLSKIKGSKKRHGLDIHNKSDKFDEIYYYKASSHKTGLPNHSYDCITINNYLYFWETNSDNLLKIYKELYRICKKDGEIRVFPVFFGNYYNDNIELFDYLNQNFSVRLLRPKKDYSNESAIYLDNDKIKKLDKSNGSVEHKENHILMSNCLILKKL